MAIPQGRETELVGGVVPMRSVRRMVTTTTYEYVRPKVCRDITGEGGWSLATGIWYLASGIWHLATGIWYLVVRGSWPVTCGSRGDSVARIWGGGRPVDRRRGRLCG